VEKIGRKKLDGGVRKDEATWRDRKEILNGGVNRKKKIGWRS